MTNKSDYLDFKLALVEKTYELYIKRMDVWEDQFYKIKYGCITVVIALLGFRYTIGLDDPFLNYLALAATGGLWLFEGALRTTFFRYVAKLDIMTETINNQSVMEKAFETRELGALRILDFDIRAKTIFSSIADYVKVAYPDITEDEQKKIAEKMISQKQQIISIWSSLKLKNNVAFYSTLIILQVIALLLFNV